MKETNESYENEGKGLGKKTLLEMGTIILITAVIIGMALYFKKRPESVPKSSTDIMLGEYKNIPLTLEKSEITEDKVKETAKWNLDYYNQNLKKGEKKLSLNKLTDEQVKKVFHMDSVKAFYDSIRDYEKKNKKKEIRNKAYNQICDYLIKNCTINRFPEEEVKKRLDQYLKDTKESCEKEYDMSFADYCKSVGMTEEEYKKNLSDHVEKTYKEELILIAIADKEKIPYKDKDFQSYIDDFVKNGGYDSKESVYEQYGEDYLKTAYRIESVTDWLIQNADITYQKTETKAPAKKKETK